MVSEPQGAPVSHQEKLTQCHLLECYLFLRDFWIESSSNAEHLQLRRKADRRTFHLKVNAEWLQMKSHATIEHRLDGLGLIPFLEKNGSAWIRVTSTGQEVITHLERDAER